MEAIDYWRFCDHLNVLQAALLIVDRDPADGSEEYVLNWEVQYRPRGFDAVFSALQTSIISGALPAKIYHGGKIVDYIYEGDEHSRWKPNEWPDWKQTTVKVDDLKKWLLIRGVKTGFFFPNSTDERAYLDKHNPHYAPKLAAAVKAWEAISYDPKLLNGRTPKQALEKFLREHTVEFELNKKEDGSPNEQGIEEICKVTNWKPGGGAAKTPTRPGIGANPPTPIKKSGKDAVSDNGDIEDIPF